MIETDEVQGRLQSIEKVSETLQPEMTLRGNYEACYLTICFWSRHVTDAVHRDTTEQTDPVLTALLF